MPTVRSSMPAIPASSTSYKLSKPGNVCICVCVCGCIIHTIHAERERE